MYKHSRAEISDIVCQCACLAVRRTKLFSVRYVVHISTNVSTVLHPFDSEQKFTVLLNSRHVANDKNNEQYSIS
jgi:hypothetical protein